MVLIMAWTSQGYQSKGVGIRDARAKDRESGYY